MPIAVPLGQPVLFVDDRAPTAADDAATIRARVGSLWRWGTRRWECNDATAGAAVWVERAEGHLAQPLDALLTALAALVTAADEMPYFTGVDTVAKTALTAFARTLLDDASAPAARTTLGAQAQDADLDALAALSGNGIAVRTGSGAWATRGMVQPAAGFTITAADGVSGNPTFVLSHDLAGLEALGSTGIAVRTAADTWAVRSLTAPAAGLTITNPAGILGNPTFALANDLAAVEGLAANGIAVRTGTDAWSVRTITASSGVAVTNGDGVAGAPAFALTGVALSLHSLTTGPGLADPLRLPRAGDLGGAAFASIEALTGMEPIDGDSNLQLLPQHGRGLVLVTSGTRTHTLPASADVPIGWWVRLKNRSGNTLTIQRSGADTIDAGATSYAQASGAGPAGAVTLVLRASGAWETC